MKKLSLLENTYSEKTDAVCDFLKPVPDVPEEKQLSNLESQKDLLESNLTITDNDWNVDIAAHEVKMLVSQIYSPKEEKDKIQEETKDKIYDENSRNNQEENQLKNDPSTYGSELNDFAKSQISKIVDISKRNEDNNGKNFFFLRS